MSQNQPKGFEEKLKSLRIGCIIFGIVFIISIGIGIRNIVVQTTSEVNTLSYMFSLILNIAELFLIIFMYKFTAEKDTKGPVFEMIFGIILIIDGVILCLTIVGLILGIIYIICGIGIINESKWFKEYIQGNSNGNSQQQYNARPQQYQANQPYNPYGQQYQNNSQQYNQQYNQGQMNQQNSYQNNQVNYQQPVNTQQNYSQNGMQPNSGYQSNVQPNNSQYENQQNNNMNNYNN